jgi:carbonyl reductase 1
MVVLPLTCRRIPFVAVCKALLELHPDVHVILGSRDISRGQAAVAQIENEMFNGVASPRLEMIQLDTSDAASVRAAALAMDGPLYGIVNNAGIGIGRTLKETMATNYWGPRHVCDSFVPLLQNPGGRIVNVCSAAGANFVSGLAANNPLKKQLGEPWTIHSIDLLDDIVQTAAVADSGTWNIYGFSKATLMAYTYLLSREYQNLVINGVTPGFIDTDLTAGFGATNSPAKGAVPILHCLFFQESVPNGRYYGSDSKRSPLHIYRDPGEPEYNGPDGPQ